MKHTQGEWESAGIAIKDSRDPIFYHIDILCNDTIRVARSSGVGRDLAIANARLIAAAPDLLDACKAQEVADDWFGSSSTGRKLKNIAKELRQTAITKTGR
jgi:hypothetical protein